MKRARRAAPWVILAGGTSLAIGLLWAGRARASTILRLQNEPLGPLLPGLASEGTDDRATGLMLEEPAFPAAVPGATEAPSSADPETMDVEAGARMIASENPRGSRRLHIEQLWTQIRSATPGQSLAARITAGSGWGPQGARQPPGRTRPVASGGTPNDSQRQLVREVLQGLEPSTLPEARKFFEPAVQDKAFAIAERARAKKARGQALSSADQMLVGYKRNAEGVLAKWSKGGRVVGTVDGVEFWT